MALFISASHRIHSNSNKLDIKMLKFAMHFSLFFSYSFSHASQTASVGNKRSTASSEIEYCCFVMFFISSFFLPTAFSAEKWRKLPTIMHIYYARNHFSLSRKKSKCRKKLIFLKCKNIFDIEEKPIQNRRHCNLQTTETKLQTISHDSQVESRSDHDLLRHLWWRKQK